MRKGKTVENGKVVQVIESTLGIIPTAYDQMTDRELLILLHFKLDSMRDSIIQEIIAGVQNLDSSPMVKMFLPMLQGLMK